MKATSFRVHEIDGIRGWAALVVLLFHLFWEIFGVIVPEFRSPKLKFFLDGPLAVDIFFVLSGDALACAYLRTSEPAFVDKLVLKRYFRLAIPIFASCALVYLLMRTGLMFHGEATPIIKRPEWLGTFLPFEPSVYAMVHYALVDVFVNHSDLISYNPFLWPMSIELVCSFLVFSYMFLLPRLKHPVSTTWSCVILLFIINPMYSLFFVGVLFSLLRDQGVLGKIRDSHWGRYLSPILLVLCALMDIASEWLTKGQAHSRALTLNFNVVLAFVIVYALYTNRWFLAFFTSCLSRFLGKISFPLYLVHFAVIASFTSYLIVWYSKRAVIGMEAAIGISLLSVVASVALASLFAPVERLFLKHLDVLIGKCLVSSKRNVACESLSNEVATGRWP